MPPVEKVLMTADSVGGVWTYALQLADELGRRDIEVTLVVMGGKPSADQAREAAALPNLSLIGTDFRLEWMREPEDDLRLAGELLLELEAERRPDLIHLNGFAHAVLPFAAPVLLAAHSDVGTWWQACRGEELPAEWAAYGGRAAAGIAAADILVAPTAAYLDEVASRYASPRARQVIPNGRDPARFAAAPKRAVALAAGRLWDEAKNIGAVCRAAEGLSWPVLVAGEATSPEGQSLSTPPNVLSLGQLSAAEMAARMAEAALFVAPARYEPFGLAILEAALSGCALILGDIASLREIWGDAALFVDPADAEALRDQMEALLFDPERAAALGRQARRRARLYTSARMGERYLQAYASLLGRRPAPVARASSLPATA